MTRPGRFTVSQTLTGLVILLLTVFAAVSALFIATQREAHRDLVRKMLYVAAMQAVQTVEREVRSGDWNRVQVRIRRFNNQPLPLHFRIADPTGTIRADSARLIAGEGERDDQARFQASAGLDDVWFEAADDLTVLIPVLGVDRTPLAILSASAPLSELMDRAHRYEIPVLLWLGAMVTLAFGVAGMLAWRLIIAPLAEIRRSAHGVMEGQAVQLPRFAVAELDLTSQALAVMLERLEQKHGQLERAKDGLEEQIRERTRELDLSRTRAEAANRAKTRFLATMSHELRTPLNAVLGYAEVISMRLYGDQALDRYADYARHIHQAGEHLLGLISQMLDAARIESGVIELTEEPIRLPSLIAGAESLVRGEAERHRVRLLVEACDPDLILRGDARALRQVLVNLLSNAIRYNRDGGLVVLSTRRVGRDLALIVRDTGIGISPADVEGLFVPFARGTGTVARPKSEGIGLGLSITKALVDLHGGSIDLTSREGEGTVVTVVLPADRLFADGTAPSPLPEPDQGAVGAEQRVRIG